jgi:hypothetical protein
MKLFLCSIWLVLASGNLTGQLLPLDIYGSEQPISLSEEIVKTQSVTTFAPQGAEWSYSSFVLFDPPPDLYKFVADGEIMINDTLATVLKFYNGESGSLELVDSLEKYVFTSGDKVYYWVQDAFYLLFDFGAQPGDTISSRAEDFPIGLSCYSDFSEGPIPFQYIIDSVRTISLGSDNLRVQYVTHIYPHTSEPAWVMQSPVVERIGQISPAGFWWGRGHACVLGGFPGELRCYEDDDIYYKNPSLQFNLECDFVSSSDDISVSKTPLYPNPATDVLFLPDMVKSVQIFNSVGNLVLADVNQHSLNVSGLVSGMYFIQYQIEDSLFLDNFVKQ